MSRNWNPGDIATAERAVGVGQTEIGVYIRTDAPLPWTGADNCSYSARELHCLRPLVVIDPEDREQVRRLDTLIYSDRFDRVDTVDGTQAALREFADPKPPKPEEPTGLGAVVEDAEGVQWVKVHDHWRRPDMIGCCYRDIAVVRVLSDGVRP